MKTIKHLRVQVTREQLSEAHAPYAKCIASSRDVAAIARSIVEAEDQEVFLVFYLDVKNRITGYTEAHRGTTTGCMVGMCDVFRGAILQAAAAIIVVHNHPSGDPTPSDDDDHVITRKLRAAGELLGVKILDHVVIGAHGRYFSFLDSGV